MRSSSFTILLITILMIIIILALIVIIGLTVMLNNGADAGTETGPFVQVISLIQEQMSSFFDNIQQWMEYFMRQIQKLSEML
ncbi:MAG: hypothetical protein WC502_09430 [Methanolinea sp.]|jgi:competence protein ComGC|nr:hypothetical protein [Methanolinea sp.]